MSTLLISLFGGMLVARDRWRREVKLTRTSQQLLAYLLLERNRWQTRDILADLFWSDRSQEQAHRCLNTALWRLRKALDEEKVPSDEYVLTSRSGEIGFNDESQYWLDVAEFEEKVNKVIKKPVMDIQPEEIKELKKALELYSGELLEGVYTDWALPAREHKRLLYLKGQAYLMAYFKLHKDYARSLECGQKILSVDPLREEIHRDMMRLFMENGQRALAVRQYETCQQYLSEELGISPMAETQSLYEQIVSGTKGINPKISSDEATELQQAIQQIQDASKNVEVASEQLQQALNYFNKILPPRK